MKQVTIHAMPRGWGKSTKALSSHRKDSNSILVQNDLLSSETVPNTAKHIIFDNCSPATVLRSIQNAAAHVEKITVFDTFMQDPRTHLIPKIPREWKVRLITVALKEETF